MTGEAKVRPFLRIVANGFSEDGKTLKATLIATPEPDLEAGADSFSLKDWPAEMAKRLKRGVAWRPGGGQPSEYAIDVEFCAMEDGSCPPKFKAPTYVRATVVGHAGITETDWHHVTAAWTGAIAGNDDTVWVNLLKDIDASLSAKKHKGDPQAQYSEAPTGKPGESFQQGAIIARRPRADDTVTIKGVIPIRQGDFALDEERVRAQRVLAKIARGPYCFDDENLRIKAPTTVVEGDTSTPDKQKEAYDKALNEQRYMELGSAITGSNDERCKSHAHFELISKMVCGAPVGPSADLNVGRLTSSDRAPIATAEAVSDGEGRHANRSGHAYGTWLQKTKNPCGAYEAEAGAGRSAEAATAFERVRGVYYSLQGDTLLSRLFCLAVDLEIPVETVSLSGVVEMAVEPAVGKRKTPRTATAAKIDPKRRQFWPVSQFELLLDAQISSKCEKEVRAAKSYVDQTAGVWNLGVGHKRDEGEAHVPRYDLISLDVRRAIDGNPQAIDRGQRHHTAGLTIIDTGRAEQIARDLALSAKLAKTVSEQCDPKCPERTSVTLYAEELTIGRRVDVAVGRAGTAVEKLKWRSLMRRYVVFEALTGPANAALGRLVGAEAAKGFADECAFQVAARSMPRLDEKADSSERSMEAIAEEAIFLWDGTPAGVLTSRKPEDKPVETPKCGVLHREQTFGRILRLPTVSEEPSGCPPPLRYGAHYVFSFRSMFLGGGSPSLADAKRTHKDTAGRYMLPPAICDASAPQRFLRHEGISAPTLLLTFKAATTSLLEMGYEAPDAAIIRSHVKTEEPAKGDACTLTPPVTSATGPTPTPADKRARPDETMRVFTPPTIAFDTLARHRVLDCANAKEIRRGGLREVRYDAGEGGFPVAVTSKAAAFNGDEAIYARKILSKHPDGAVVFTPGVNTPSTCGHGFLPDPAAEVMALRLRRRGNDLYLAGHIAVDLYEGEMRACYPNVLPLVVTIKRLTGVRAKPAQSVREVVTGNPAGIWHLNADEKIVSKGSGPRVRHLTITLAQGEDFDCEVVCLPKPVTFATMFSLPETIAIQLATAAKDKDGKAKLEQLCGPVVCPPCKPEDNAGALTIGFGGLCAPSADDIRNAAEKVLDAITGSWPIEEVASVTTLRVCHAINAPVTAPQWRCDALSDGKPDLDRVSIGRPPRPAKDNFAGAATKMDEALSTTVLLKGALRLDLEQADAFEIVVRTVAARGGPIDDPARSRSLIDRRSGRWPKMTVKGGERRYVPTRDVVGFHVDAEGRATLPQETVTLLRVDNLPVTGERASGDNALYGAAGSAIGLTTDRLTRLDLGVLHAAALAEGKIEIPLGSDAPKPDPNGPESLKRKRTIKTDKPALLADTRARQLVIQAVALSRHAESLETAPRYVDSEEILLDRRRPITPGEQSRPSRELTIWSPATERPAKCEPRRPAPTFVIERSAGRIGKATVHAFKRRALTRIYLKRGWFSSGEGERLGVVLWPPRYFEQPEEKLACGEIKLDKRTIHLPEFEDADLGPAGSFITRWGGDPIRKDDAPDDRRFIPPSTFRDMKTCGCPPHQSGYVPVALMPTPKSDPQSTIVVPAGERYGTGDDGSKSAATDGAEFLEVSLLTYEPCFDLDREEWYVDIDLRPSCATDPFVRFGLVRYQEHAINRQLQVSEPVVVWAQILPERKLEVSCTPRGGAIDLSVTLEGQAYSAIKDLKLESLAERGTPEHTNAKAVFDSLQTPKLRMSLVHETDGGAPLRTPVDRRGEPLTTSAKVANGRACWEICTTIPADRRKELKPGTFFAYLEEYEERMAASYAVEPVNPLRMFASDGVRASGPRFAARVAFFEDYGDGSDQALADCETGPLVTKY